MSGENPENARTGERAGEAERVSQAEQVSPAERADFDRRELSALLRLFSSLGVTVAVGITGCFWLGVWAERRLAGAGVDLGAGPRIAGLVFGLGLTGYWAYRRIAGHLAEFEGGGRGRGGRQKTPAEKEGVENERGPDAR